MDALELTRALVALETPTGSEGPATDFLDTLLRRAGYHTVRQPVSPGRENLYAYRASPTVVFSTHLDTVPPYVPLSEDADIIHGRGSCDAKGLAAAMIAAAERLSGRGEQRIGLLFLVGEENGSDGARVAGELSPRGRFLINGEPTENRLSIGQKGSLRVDLTARGKAAHSAYPEEGDSAIEKLLDILTDLRQTKLPTDDFFGETTLNIGLISGGLATNVIPPFAEAGLHIRMVSELEPVQQALEKAVAGRGELEVMSCSLPVKMLEVEGFQQKVVRFTTDIPHLPNWGTPLLLGAGSILVAHTKDEFVLKKDLEESVGLYENLVKKLLSS